MRWLNFIALSLCVGPLTHAAEQSPSAPAKTTPPAETIKVDDQAMDIPIQAGQDIFGIRIPQYDAEGKLQMQFAAEIARKLDDKTLEFEVLKIEVTDKDGMVQIDIPKSRFNLETRVLTGNEGAKITRQDFEITGDTVEFHVRTRFSRLGGNVKMIINSLDAVKDE